MTDPQTLHLVVFSDGTAKSVVEQFDSLSGALRYWVTLDGGATLSTVAVPMGASTAYDAQQRALEALLGKLALHRAERIVIAESGVTRVELPSGAALPVLTVAEVAAAKREAAAALGKPPSKTTISNADRCFRTVGRRIEYVVYEARGCCGGAGCPCGRPAALARDFNGDEVAANDYATRNGLKVTTRHAPVRIRIRWS